jgi:glutathione S-transferase
MKLYFHPLSSYSQKVLVALYEKGVAFTPEVVDMMSPAAKAEYRKLHPIGKVPLLVTDAGRSITESSIIIDWLDDEFASSGTRLIPERKDQAREARFFDRIFDIYVNDPMATIFFDGRKPPELQEPIAVANAKTTLDTVYAQYDEHFAKRTWAIGDAFTIADCSAAPALGYARMVHPFDKFKHLSAYAGRLSERPSFARVLTEAQPWFAKFNAR